MSILRGVLLAAACALILVVTPASSNNGMVFTEFPFEETNYVDCLGEEIYSVETVEMWSHEVVTPSGNYHTVINFDISGYSMGLTSGFTWDFHKVRASIKTNMSKGETSQFVVQGVRKPTSPGAPMLSWHVDFKITVTANGDLIVFRPPSGLSKVRCIWKN